MIGFQIFLGMLQLCFIQEVGFEYKCCPVGTLRVTNQHIIRILTKLAGSDDQVHMFKEGLLIRVASN